MEEGSCNPSGASVSRGGGTNAPASVYAIRKWDEWLRKYAPPGAADYDFYQSLPALSQGNVAQQIFWYRSEEHTSELQSLMRTSYAVFCLKKKKTKSKTRQE